MFIDHLFCARLFWALEIFQEIRFSHKAYSLNYSEKKDKQS